MKPEKRKKEWFDDEALWRETYAYIFPEERFASAVETIEKVLTLVQPRGRTALDLACGPGRCSVPLSKRGFAVTGVDSTAFLLKKAKERARKERVKVEWVLRDMRDFIRPDTYDLALSVFTSFGYFDDVGEDVAVLRNVFKSLRPGGAFFLDVNGKEVLARKYLPSSVEKLPDGSILIERREIQDGWARIRNEWTVIRDGKARTFPVNINMYSGQELRDRLEGSGFVAVKLYGGLDREPYDVKARRLIAVARKPE
jgi:SAM-dependent methyltransferase